MAQTHLCILLCICPWADCPIRYTNTRPWIPWLDLIESQLLDFLFRLTLSPCQNLLLGCLMSGSSPCAYIWSQSFWFYQAVQFHILVCRVKVSVFDLSVGKTSKLTFVIYDLTLYDGPVGFRFTYNCWCCWRAIVNVKNQTLLLRFFSFLCIWLPKYVSVYHVHAVPVETRRCQIPVTRVTNST